MSRFTAPIHEVSWRQPSPHEQALAAASASDADLDQRSLPPLPRTLSCGQPLARAACSDLAAPPLPVGVVGPLTKQDVMMLILFAVVLGIFFYTIHLSGRVAASEKVVHVLLSRALLGDGGR